MKMKLLCAGIALAALTAAVSANINVWVSSGGTTWLAGTIQSTGFGNIYTTSWAAAQRILTRR